MGNVTFDRIARNLGAAALSLGLLVLAWNKGICCDSAACPAVPVFPAINLPHLRAALQHRVEGLVVALGSSSTQGVMASDLAHSYPALLQQLLSAGLPQAHIAVINRGIGGQDAAEELARLDADVIALRPRPSSGRLAPMARCVTSILLSSGILVSRASANCRPPGIDVS